ncbi:MAG: hypothetical protein U1F66_01615 [bacterium]
MDQLVFSGDGHAAPVQEALRFEGGSELRLGLARLSATQLGSLRAQIPDAAREELIDLAREGDPQLYAEALLNWARREERANRLANAGLVYQMLSQRAASGEYLFPGASEALRRSAGAALDAIQGRGAMGNRLEFLGRRFAQEASDPIMIAGMAAGSFVFSTARTAFLSRLLASPGRGLIGARALASTGAFLLEVPAFWGTTKGLREAIDPGRQSWDLNTNLRELAGLGLSLGALKLSGALAGSLSRRLASSENPALWGSAERMGHGLLHQGGTLAGILVGHRLEEAAHLRPHVDGATTLIDSLAMLLQFHVGGRLSQEAMGPRFQAYTRDLELRGRWLEQQALAEGQGRIRDRLRDFFNGGGTSGLTPILAGAGGGRLGPSSGAEDGMAEARSHIHAMSMDPEGPGNGLNTGGPLLVEGAPESQPRSVRELPVALPERRGTSKDSMGQVVDRFEPAIAPQKMLRLIPEAVQAEILEHIGLRRSELSQVNDLHLGRGLGSALEKRMREVMLGLTIAGEGKNRENYLSQLREALQHADEMVGMVEYFRRSNQRSILDTLWNSVDPGVREAYEPFKATLLEILGPHFRMPEQGGARGSEVIQPHDAVLSIGSGDMMGLLALYRHQIRPGGHSWRTRLFVNARQASVADEINQKGTYQGNTNLRGVQINYAGDPRILAVGPQGYEGVSREMLQRTVRLQILNVPSDKLHEILTPEYIKNLPENAILLEVIGGFIGPDRRGPYQPARGERRTVLPYQLINQALRAHGREDVQVVSGGGYIPGKALWRGYVQGRNPGEMHPVEMVFAGPDGDTNISEAAELVAESFAGRSRDNGFLRAASTHHQHSTELGKAMKNVTSLLAGYEAGRLAQQMWDGAVQVFNPGAEYKDRIREPLFSLMEGLLLQNETGINPIKARYRAEVRNDYWNCTDINMEEVRRVTGLARKAEISDPEARREAMRRFLSDPEAQRNFLAEHVVNNPAIATTRNPKRGIAQALVEMWRGMGSVYRTDELLPRKGDGSPAMTQEGVNSLPPLMDYYSFENHPIERRRLDDRLYSAFRTFNSDLVIDPPPQIPEHIARALTGVHPELNEARLRRALEGKSERALGLLNSELRRLERYRGLDRKKYPDSVTQQVEVVHALKTAMLEGTPLRLTRSPIIRHPYGNMFIIKMLDHDGRRDSYRAFIRVDGHGVMDRITQMGTFLRSFPEGARLLVEVEATGFHQRKDAASRYELEHTVGRILTAFRQSRESDDVDLIINRREILPDAEERQPFSPEYFQALQPLVERLTRGREGTGVSANSVRNAAAQQAQILSDFLQHSPGWPMVLGYFGGPLNSAIKSAMTRPERGTFIGVYDNGRLVDAFSVFRGYDNQPRALSHHLLSRLAAEFRDRSEYQDLASVDYFDGLELGRFLEDFERYSARIGRGDLEYRMIPLRSLPIEEALAGKVPGINPALLRLFLEQEQGAGDRQQMLAEIAPLYERPMPEIRDSVRDLLTRYLDPFYERNRAFLDQVPIFRFFEKKGAEAITDLIRNGEDPAAE